VDAYFEELCLNMAKTGTRHEAGYVILLGGGSLSGLKSKEKNFPSVGNTPLRRARGEVTWGNMASEVFGPECRQGKEQ